MALGYVMAICTERSVFLLTERSAYVIAGDERGQLVFPLVRDGTGVFFQKTLFMADLARFVYDHCIYTYYLSRRLDIQSPLSLTPTWLDAPPNMINNQSITGIHSNDATTDNAFSIHIQLPNCRPQDIIHLLVLQLTDMQTQGRHTNQTSLSTIASVNTHT
jgi:hypothetical protein